MLFRSSFLLSALPAALAAVDFSLLSRPESDFVEGGFKAAPRGSLQSNVWKRHDLETGGCAGGAYPTENGLDFEACGPMPAENKDYVLFFESPQLEVELDVKGGFAFRVRGHASGDELEFQAAGCSFNENVPAGGFPIRLVKSGRYLHHWYVAGITCNGHTSALELKVTPDCVETALITDPDQEVSATAPSFEFRDLQGNPLAVGIPQADSGFAALGFCARDEGLKRVAFSADCCFLGAGMCSGTGPQAACPTALTLEGDVEDGTGAGLPGGEDDADDAVATTSAPVAMTSAPVEDPMRPSTVRFSRVMHAAWGGQWLFFCGKEEEFDFSGLTGTWPPAGTKFTSSCEMGGAEWVTKSVLQRSPGTHDTAHCKDDAYGFPARDTPYLAYKIRLEPTVSLKPTNDRTMGDSPCSVAVEYPERVRSIQTTPPIQPFPTIKVSDVTSQGSKPSTVTVSRYFHWAWNGDWMYFCGHQDETDWDTLKGVWPPAGAKLTSSCFPSTIPEVEAVGVLGASPSHDATQCRGRKFPISPDTGYEAYRFQIKNVGHNGGNNGLGETPCEMHVTYGEDQFLPVFGVGVGGMQVSVPNQSGRGLNMNDLYRVRIEPALAAAVSGTDEDYERRVKLSFHIEYPRGVTGIATTITDSQSGAPSGLHVQISKNWHNRADRVRYDSYFYTATINLRVPEVVSEAVEFDLNFIHQYFRSSEARKTHTVSHAQLSLIGWGTNGLWEEVGLGSSGEAITYEPNGQQRRNTVLDTRPFLTCSMNELTNGVEECTNTPDHTAWTHNHGGSDFITAVDTAGSYQYNTDVKTFHQMNGPVLTEATYTGGLSDDLLTVERKVSTWTTDAFVAHLHSFTYTFAKDVSTSIAQEYPRFALYILGGDWYNYVDSPKFVYGTSEGKVEEEGWDLASGVSRFHYASDWKSVEGPGACGRQDSAAGLAAHSSCWFAFLTPESQKSSTGASRGLIVRSWEMQLGGHVYGREGHNQATGEPPFSFSVMQNGWGKQALALELELSEKLRNIPVSAGDYVKADVELILTPRTKDMYIGNSQRLKDQLAAFAADAAGEEAWKLVERHSKCGDEISVEVASDSGSVERKYPPRVAVENAAGASYFRLGLPSAHATECAGILPLSISASESDARVAQARATGVSPLWIFRNGDWENFATENDFQLDTSVEGQAKKAVYTYALRLEFDNLGDCVQFAFSNVKPTRAEADLGYCSLLIEPFQASRGLKCDHATVRIERPLSAGGSHHMHYSEIELYTPSGDKLQLKEHSASPYCAYGQGGATPGKVIDGDITTLQHSAYGSGTVSNSQDHWMEFEVDSAGGFEVEKVKVWHRSHASGRINGCKLQLKCDGEVLKEIPLSRSKFISAGSGQLSYVTTWGDESFVFSQPSGQSPVDLNPTELECTQLSFRMERPTSIGTARGRHHLHISELALAGVNPVSDSRISLGGLVEASEYLNPGFRGTLPDVVVDGDESTSIHSNFGRGTTYGSQDHFLEFDVPLSSAPLLIQKVLLTHNHHGVGRAYNNNFELKCDGQVVSSTKVKQLFFMEDGNRRYVDNLVDGPFSVTKKIDPPPSGFVRHGTGRFLEEEATDAGLVAVLGAGAADFLYTFDESAVVVGLAATLVLLAALAAGYKLKSR